MKKTTRTTKKQLAPKPIPSMEMTEATFETLMRTFTDDQIRALIYILQDMLNGRTNILCSTVDISDMALREERGYMRCLREISTQIGKLYNDALYGDGQDGDYIYPETE